MKINVAVAVVVDVLAPSPFLEFDEVDDAEPPFFPLAILRLSFAAFFRLRFLISFKDKR